jgi:hypothetical protein
MKACLSVRVSKINRQMFEIQQFEKLGIVIREAHSVQQRPTEVMINL